MNALIICYSKFGNTRLVADAIAETLGSNGAARVVNTDRLAVSDLEGADLVVMGTPTHRMNLPKEVRPVLDALPRGALRGTRVAAFDTSYKMSWLLARFTAARRLDRKLRRLGGKRALPPETFFVQASEGPLYDGEIERAHAWATLLLAQVRQPRTRNR